LEPDAEARARRAGAMGRVEREAPRLEIVDRRPVVRAGIPLAEALLLEGSRLTVTGRRGDQDDTLPEPQRGLDGIREPRRIGVLARGAGLGIDRPAAVVAAPAAGRLRPPDHVPIDDDL